MMRDREREWEWEWEMEMHDTSRLGVVQRSRAAPSIHFASNWIRLDCLEQLGIKWETTMT